MFRRILSSVIVSLLLHTFVCINSVSASSDSEKVKASIRKIYVGQQAQVEIKLRDKTKMKGYISEIGDDTFILTDSRTGTATAIAYSNVEQVKQRKLSSRGKDIEFVVILVGIVVLLAAFARGN